MGVAGSSVANIAGYLVSNTYNETNHRVGPEYLLARTDWETQFDNLKKMPWTDPFKNAAMRAAKFPKDAVMNSVSVAKEVFTPTNLVKNGAMLGGGYAGISAAQAAVAKVAEQSNLPEAAVVALKEGVNTLGGAPVFAAWTTAGVMTQPFLDKVKDAVFNNNDSHVDAGTSGMAAESDSMAIEFGESSRLAAVSDDTSIELGESGRVADTDAGKSNRFTSNRFVRWMTDTSKPHNFGADPAKTQESESAKAPIITSSRRSDTAPDLGSLSDNELKPDGFSPLHEAAPESSNPKR
jgi:hypothetical protein